MSPVPALTMTQPNSPSPIPWSPTHARLHRCLQQRSLLPAQATVLIAVSGGQDSVALLRLLLDLQPHWHWQLRVGHCDHRWRPDSAQNAAFVADLCQGWGIPCQVLTAPPLAPGEAAARQWRYGVLGELAQSQGCTYLVTGHTASDRAETLLYNLMRGSGSDGLQALVWQRPLGGDRPDLQLIRPLLDFTRGDITSLCQRFNLPYWNDSTNQDLTYARNRLRLAVLPYLKNHFNPDVDRTLAQTAEILSAEVALLNTLTLDLYQQVVEFRPADQSCRLHRPPLRSAPLALQRRLITQVLRQVMTVQPTFDRVESLVSLIQAPQGSQSSPLPGGLVASVQAEWIVLLLNPSCGKA
ncbi:MAG: tRNA lysidine(34) synthetase TilS [Nodosilinea sp.]